MVTRSLRPRSLPLEKRRLLEENMGFTKIMGSQADLVPAGKEEEEVAGGEQGVCGDRWAHWGR